MGYKSLNYSLPNKLNNYVSIPRKLVGKQSFPLCSTRDSSINRSLSITFLKEEYGMIIEKINGENREKALALVLSVFMRYEAPDYSEKGIQTFVSFINNKESISGLEFYGAFINGKIAGVIATRSCGNHIALFFVDGKYHRQGIGRKLFETVIKESTEEIITVNSSPYAVEVYKKLGFIPDRDEQLMEGMRYTPMTYIK